jgi:hypothetical protein
VDTPDGHPNSPIFGPICQDVIVSTYFGEIGLKVLKKNKQITLLTLLQNKVSQYEIERVTGIDRKTIRSYQRKFREGELNSPGVATD